MYWLLDPTNTYNGCDQSSECPSGANARRRNYSSGGTFDVLSTAFYLQDTWEVSNRLTLEVGIRNETFENKNGAGETFVEMDNQWAPRLSAVWDPTGEAKQKIYANWGLYYLPVASNTNIRLAGQETYIHDFYDWDGECLNADFSPCNLGSIYRTDVLSDGNVPDTRSVVDADLDPMYQSEFILGYQYITDEGLEFGVKGMYRKLESSIEDMAIDGAVINYYNTVGNWTYDSPVEEVFDGFHQYVLANPGSDLRVFIEETGEFIDLSANDLGYPEAERQYGSLEFTFHRPFDGSWMLDASYTWAHSWGNNEGYVRSDNGQDDAGLTTAFDQPSLVEGAYGNLPNDRRHTVKARGFYRFENKLSLGASFIWQTGRPRNCFGVHPDENDFSRSYGADTFYCNGVLGKRGNQGRTPNMWNLDMNAQYPIQLPGDQELLVSLDVFNVFNNDAVTEVNEYADTDGGQPNPNYRLPSSYQSPRMIRLGLRYDFD
ncbi:TonB-dependent receptor [Marinibactrum halimedae]|uniref:TonB-dependent transporter Oar-like beta-barrel domain-containing protein n=1 Tax=Marinibactrum halimedae TaxID=1444977 RepID=A0AA37WLU7_9GAMM|nr:TonB-dependent receptor [Marinibactrum halimedae]MCD9461296.1 TonB-dependent receptor [Marinibactrum halimedae]GLS26404.1 hypothetical protein GCM10007877_21190 [Marinibactrum halimedae]